ncbi:hypothetical protein Hanom_Chr16g01513211 [Helianthus anomalus]
MKMQGRVFTKKGASPLLFFFTAPDMVKTNVFSPLRLALGACLSRVFTKKAQIRA